jgi:DNA-directed RNA polymerase specialized sigma24 family protein
MSRQCCSVHLQVKRITSSIFREAAKRSGQNENIIPEESAKSYPFIVKDRVKEIHDSILKKGPRSFTVKECVIKEDSNEAYAVALGLDQTGKKVLSESERFRIGTSFYTCINKLVYQHCNKYQKVPGVTVDDLAQSCMERAMEYLWRYDPKIAKLTTWIWYICRSVCNKKYKTGKKYSEIFSDAGHTVNGEEGDGSDPFENLTAEPIEGIQHYECQGVMANEIGSAIIQLIDDYPYQKNLIINLFGDPNQEGYTLPHEIDVAGAAKTTGMEVYRVEKFCKNVVRPFLKEQLVGCV